MLQEDDMSLNEEYVNNFFKLKGDWKYVNLH